MPELVRYATLAPNSHNAQPWRFRIERMRITVMADFSRSCPAVDPDDHHLFVSLGCATENLILAAHAHGLRSHPTVTTEGAIRVDFEPTSPSESAQYRAIPERQSTRADYDGRSVPTDQLALLEEAGRSRPVAVRIFTDHRDLERILEFVVAGNTVQMRDEAFMTELKKWLRFSESAVVRHRDGLFSASSGNPTVPNWLGQIVFNLAFTEDSENDKYASHIRSSAGVIAFVSERDDIESWVEVGRCFQRFALQATALGLRHAHINQAVEVPEVRAQFSDYLGIGDRRPDLLVRFGYGQELPKSLRRPVEEVLG